MGVQREGDEPLVRRVVRIENDAGEWSVADLDFGYRVCAFNPAHYGGVHVHTPSGETRPVDVPSPKAAERIVKRYAERVDRGFDWRRFLEEVKRWRSE